MRSKVRLSVYSLLITAVVTGVLIFACITTFGNTRTFFILLVITLVLALCALLCAPLQIRADEKEVVVKSSLRKFRLRNRNIESVELFRPTMGSIRLFASGGYMGYWGLFREGDIGRYMAFYGKASDCFLLKMKNGDKYVLGCDNPESMVNYINSQIRVS